jgi:hypothetical protein
MARKRNLEGNDTNPNLFSALPNDKICNLLGDMGVLVEQENFDTFSHFERLGDC